LSATATTAGSSALAELEPALSVVEAPAASRPAGALLMSLGTVGSGALAYAFNVLAARVLGPDAYGPIAVLWAVMFLFAVVLFRPIEQTLSRALAERAADRQDSRAVVRSVAALAIALVVAACGGCLIAWGPITARLFSGQGFLTAMLIAGIAGYGAAYFVRGLVGGHRWYAAYGTALLADGGVRVALVLPLLVVASSSWAALALAGAAIAGAIAPLLMPGRAQLRSTGDAPGPEFRLRDATRFAGSTTVVAIGDQVLISGGPVLVMLQGGPHAEAAAGVVFAATMLVRAPAYLFQGVAAALLPNLTRMVAQRDHRAFRRTITRTVAGLSAVAGLMVLGALVAGPLVMRTLYGDGFDGERVDLALLAAGAGGYLVAAALSQAALAQSREVAVAAVWAVSAALFVGLELLLGGAPLHRVAVAFAVAALANAGAFLVLALTKTADEAPQPRPMVRVAAATSGDDPR
jgi:O-antigen/teichoic acid export membrane protein